MMMLRAGMTVMGVMLLAAAVAAQPVPFDEPHMWPATSSPATTVTGRSAKPVPRSRFRLSLEASGGYMAYARLFAETFKGPVINASLWGTWEMNAARSARLGFRLNGFFTPSGHGDFDGLFEEAKYIEGSMWGASAGFVVESKGFWLSPGLGVTQLRYTMDPFENDRVDRESTLPEFTLATGYNLALTDRVSLRISATVSTLIISYRAQTSLGIMTRF